MLVVLGFVVVFCAERGRGDRVLGDDVEDDEDVHHSVGGKLPVDSTPPDTPRATTQLRLTCRMA